MRCLCLVPPPRDLVLSSPSVSMESVIATIPLKCACIYKFFEKDIFSREVTEGNISTPHQKHAGFAGSPRERGRQCIGNLPIQAPWMSGSLSHLPGALSIFLPSSEVSKDKKQLLAGSLGQCFLSLTPESLTFQATPKPAKSTHLPMAGGNCIHFFAPRITVRKVTYVTAREGII